MSSSVLRNVIHPRQPGSLGAADAVEKNEPPADTARSSQDVDQVMAVLVENAPVAMAMFDQQMRYMLANRAWIEEFGLKNVKPLLGRSQYEVFPSLHPGWRQVYEKALQGHIIRSEHDALAADQDCRVIYRWEVRPWRRQSDAGVGGLMITCERFVQPAEKPATEADSKAAPAKAASQVAEAAAVREPALSVPQVRLDDQGIILHANPAAARLSLSHGLMEGKTAFWDAFADGTGESAMLKRGLMACLQRLGQEEGPESAILTPSAEEVPSSPWGSAKPATCPPWLVTRHEDGRSFAALALPPEAATPRLAAPPPNLSAIASAVASIAQPPAAAPEPNGGTGSQALEIRRLQDDLARARQELKNLQDAERASQSNGGRMSTYLDALPCGVLVLDDMGAVLFQNQPLARLLGRPVQPQESIEDWLAAACPGEKHRQQVSSLWREDVWRRQLTRCFSLATADGLLKELEFQPARLPGGGLLVCIQDATEKCRHEELLRATEAKFRAILQESPTAIVLLDKAGSVFEVNHAAEHLFGQPKSELRRHPIQRWLDVPSAAALASSVQDLRGNARSLEAVVVQPSGGAPAIPASLRLAPVLDSEGQPHSTIYFFQKSTPGEGPAGADTPSEGAALAEILLLKTNVNGRIKECTPRGLQLLGLDEEQARGRALHLHFRPSDATGFYSDLSRLAAKEGGPPQELACYSTSGARQMLRVKVHPLGGGGYDFAITEVVATPSGTAAPAPAATSQPGDEWTPVSATAGKGVMPTVDLARERLVLTETHHRIKNHLQIISSLLNLESNTTSDPAARGALRSSQNRVRAIADLHQHLYQAALGSDDSFIVFARGLLDRLRVCYDVPASRVNVQFDVESGAVQQEWLMPLALTLNETLSNCFEHAFPEGRSGLVHVALRFRKDKGELNITDDGAGMPTDRSGSGLGLKILAVFAEQMRGQLLLGRPATGGTEVLLRFPVGANA